MLKEKNIQDRQLLHSGCSITAAKHQFATYVGLHVNHLSLILHVQSEMLFNSAVSNLMRSVFI